MARIRTSVLPVNPFSKYTLKQLHEKIKNYNIQNYSKMKKAELTEYLNQRYVMNNDILVLKTAGFPSQFQMNQPDNLAFNPDKNYASKKNKELKRFIYLTIFN